MSVYIKTVLYTMTSLLVLLSSPSTLAQVNHYLYERKLGETASDFVARSLPGLQDYAMKSHSILEGFWGDETKGKKIIAFFETGITDQYIEASLLVFQPVGDGKSYILLFYEGLGGLEHYYHGVISVFFRDVNKDGSKELILLEKGEAKVSEEIVTEENGELKKEYTYACCEELYRVSIIQQVKSVRGNFLPQIAMFFLPEHWSFEGASNATEIKKILKTYGVDK